MSTTFESFIVEGKAFIEKREYEKAFQRLSRAIYLVEESVEEALLPEEALAELHVLRGTALRASDEAAALNDEVIFSQVLEDYDQAVDWVPYEAAYYQLRGALYLHAKVADYREEAYKDLSEALKLDEKHLDTLRSMGEYYALKEDFDNALRYYNQVLRIAPDAETYALRAKAKIQKPSPSVTSALADFEQSLQLDPAQEDIYLWRAECLQLMGSEDKALEELNRLIDLAPEQPEYYLQRGILQIEFDPEAALADYTQAIEMGELPDAYNNRADYYRRNGRYAEAIADAEKALTIDPSQSIAYATLAEIYADMDADEAFYQYLELALAHYYTDPLEAMEEPGFQAYSGEAKFQTLLANAVQQKEAKG